MGPWEAEAWGERLKQERTYRCPSNRKTSTFLQWNGFWAGVQFDSEGLPGVDEALNSAASPKRKKPEHTAY